MKIARTCSSCAGVPAKSGGAVCGTCKGSGREHAIVSFAEAIGDVHEARDTIWAYEQWQKGLVPERGGLMDQAAVYLETMSVLDHEFARIRSEMEEEAKKRRKRKPRE